MSNPFQDTAMKQYFASLPPFVQESIRQSGLLFDSVEHLKTFAENLKKN